MLALPCLFALLLGSRVILAQTVRLESYDREQDAESYLALPYSGANFTCNSRIGYGAGRYYLRGKTAATVLAAYAGLEKSHPGLKYMYAEMGLKGGGPFKPHRTHQKGLSADFITPVYRLDKNGKRLPAMLPANALNFWGYEVRLDERGVFEDYHLDTAAMIAHLAALDESAKNYGLQIERVIFDPPLLRILRADPSFKSVSHLSFMKTQAWFPHDGHYHVDFAE